ncbi:MAG: hypothetical protein QOE77_2489 [Blastocatellia bacterium]|nr:hypothetical protein [Blastocatellia bacterium]
MILREECPFLPHLDQGLGRSNSDPSELDQDLGRLNPDPSELDEDLGRLNPDPSHLDQDFSQLNPDPRELDQDLGRLNPDPIDLDPVSGDQNRDLKSFGSNLSNDLLGRVCSSGSINRPGLPSKEVSLAVIKNRESHTTDCSSARGARASSISWIFVRIHCFRVASSFG